MNTTSIINITPLNVLEQTLFCIKDLKNPGFQNKKKWFEKQYKQGLRMKILKETNSKMIGFIEYVPAMNAWRPVNAKNYMFIHCMYISSKKDRNNGAASLLLHEAEKESRALNMSGICVMTSDGAWITDKRIFEKNDYLEVDRRGRFELLSKKWDITVKDPNLNDWTLQQKKYKGWNLLYADQCPWHEKSVFALLNTAHEYGIDLKVRKIKNAKEAQNAPSGFGVFNLLRDGRLLEDHYLSATRFRNILKKELENHG